MDLKVFDNQKKSELSMIEVAHAILSHYGETMTFTSLVNEVQRYLDKSDEEVQERLSQFYTDLNVDGSFISLGNNTWGLRAWYPYESIDEATIGGKDDEGDQSRNSSYKASEFLVDVDDDDIIDYYDDGDFSHDEDENSIENDDKSDELNGK